MGIKDLFAGERGLFAIVLILAATVLTALGHMTTPEWKDFALYVFGIFVGGKTITTSVGLFATKGAPTLPAAPAPAPPPVALPATP